MTNREGPDTRFSKHEAHPFEPGSEQEPGKPPRCGRCGERREQIRHHPTRIAAACLLRGLEPASVLGDRR